MKMIFGVVVSIVQMLRHYDTCDHDESGDHGDRSLQLILDDADMITKIIVIIVITQYNKHT